MEMKLRNTYLLFSGFIVIKRIKVIRLRYLHATRYFYISIDRLGLDSSVRIEDYFFNTQLDELRDKVLSYSNERDMKAHEARMSFEMAKFNAKILARAEKQMLKPKTKNFYKLSVRGTDFKSIG